ncbi:attacin-A-like [Drosophila navojoa]|nr:attacin-A-like [Drosophila navojoa]
MDCQVNKDPKTGIAKAVNCGVSVGDEKVNARVGVFDKGVFGAVNVKTETGHSASLGVKHIPNYHMTTVNASGSANLYTSPSGNLNVGATANAMRHTSGPFRGKSDMGCGLNMQYKF